MFEYVLLNKMRNRKDRLTRFISTLVSYRRVHKVLKLYTFLYETTLYHNKHRYYNIVFRWIIIVFAIPWI